MKFSSLIIFLSIVLSVYALINFYIFIRGWQAIPDNSSFKKIYLITFLFVSFSFIAGRILERFWLNQFTDIIVWIGSFWLAAILYFLFIIIFLDLIRTINVTTPFYPAFATFNYEKTKLVLLIFSVLLVSGILYYGFHNARNPKITTLNLNINKSPENLKELNIVMASDIHLGTIIDSKQFGKIVDMMNGLKPDIVLLAGDIVDEDLGPVIRNNVGETLKNIRSKYGVYGITGNHEYIGGVDDACKYLSEHNVTMLRDTTILIDNSFYVIGREDRDMSRFAGKKRKTLEELLKNVDRNYPMILMNHQPFELDETAKSGIDLQVSGHTHHGQIFPLNFITSLIFEVSTGYVRKNLSHIYVSTGVGTWGPPVRIGNTPEIVNIKLKFAGQ